MSAFEKFHTVVLLGVSVITASDHLGVSRCHLRPRWCPNTPYWVELEHCRDWQNWWLIHGFSVTGDFVDQFLHSWLLDAMNAGIMRQLDDKLTGPRKQFCTNSFHHL